jgi:hypothetical protein
MDVPPTRYPIGMTGSRASPSRTRYTPSYGHSARSSPSCNSTRRSTPRETTSSATSSSVAGSCSARATLLAKTTASIAPSARRRSRRAAIHRGWLRRRSSDFGLHGGQGERLRFCRTTAILLALANGSERLELGGWRKAGKDGGFSRHSMPASARAESRRRRSEAIVRARFARYRAGIEKFSRTTRFCAWRGGGSRHNDAWITLLRYPRSSLVVSARA